VADLRVGDKKIRYDQPAEIEREDAIDPEFIDQPEDSFPVVFFTASHERVMVGHAGEDE